MLILKLTEAHTNNSVLLKDNIVNEEYKLEVENNNTQLFITKTKDTLNTGFAQSKLEIGMTNVLCHVVGNFLMFIPKAGSSTGSVNPENLPKAEPKTPLPISNTFHHMFEIVVSEDTNAPLENGKYNSKMELRPINTNVGIPGGCVASS